jgi:hypothetical protein
MNDGIGIPTSPIDINELPISEQAPTTAHLFRHKRGSQELTSPRHGVDSEILGDMGMWDQTRVVTLFFGDGGIIELANKRQKTARHGSGPLLN